MNQATCDAATRTLRDLLAVARARREDFGATLADHVFDRLLFRIGSLRLHDKVALGGPSLLRAWLPDSARRTSTVELHATDDPVTTLDAVQVELKSESGELTFEVGQRVRGGVLPVVGRVGAAGARFSIVVKRAEVLNAIPLDTVRPILPGLAAARMRSLAPEWVAADLAGALIDAGPIGCPLPLVYDLCLVLRRLSLAGTSLLDPLHQACSSSRYIFEPYFPDVFAANLARIPGKRSQWNALARLLAPRSARSLPSLDSESKLLNQFFSPLHKVLIMHDDFPFIWTPGGPWKKSK